VTLRRVAWGLLSVSAGALWVGPYLWMLLTSLKTLPELLHDPGAFLPRQPSLAAYREVFEAVPFARYFLTTTLMATLIATVQVLLALPAGYAVAKLVFAGRRASFALVLLCLLVPAQVTFVPVFLMLGAVGQLNSMTALVLPFAASALGTFLLRQAMAAIPDELIEAARLDGAGDFYIVYRLLAPMTMPAITALFLLSFVFHWNDYFWPLVMTSDDHVRTLPLAVALLREQGTGMRWHVVMAGSVLLSGPVLLLFAFTQKFLVRGVSTRAH
jgi:sn-glycerol 3-phosphate transport system permease protein